ncbi:N-acyl amino acid synthase FeeM domain-containing protein [Hoeflea poritis]|uniref:N-acyl amino acid synthase FeeM catalytic core domain-containing protein n=1 Tax=Hoeflea poritis TaxID=2993659 RepID=A0ABT4VSL6_9HYPH|nr:hypothetical protein [Hoeflea poritis]MDA4847185.1 hypothetical protein [Hoeflea poritis]
MTQTVGAVSAYTTKLLKLLDRVEYRRIDNLEDMEDVARLRRKAYIDADILPVEGEMLIDELDFDPQAYVFGVYYDEQLVSTVRIHHVTPAHRVSSTRKIFPEAVDAFLDAGMTLIDPVRLAADPDLLEELPAIPYLTLRIATMATDYFKVDQCLSLVKPQHAAFYRRVFRSKQIVAPTSNCDDYKIDLTLLAAHVPVELPKVYRRFPFFRSQPFEQRMMFAPPEELSTMPLTIRPTARYIQAA